MEVSESALRRVVNIIRAAKYCGSVDSDYSPEHLADSLEMARTGKGRLQNAHTPDAAPVMAIIFLEREDMRGSAEEEDVWIYGIYERSGGILM